MASLQLPLLQPPSKRLWLFRQRVPDMVPHWRLFEDTERLGNSFVFLFVPLGFEENSLQKRAFRASCFLFGYSGHHESFSPQRRPIHHAAHDPFRCSAGPSHRVPFEPETPWKKEKAKSNRPWVRPNEEVAARWESQNQKDSKSQAPRKKRALYGSKVLFICYFLLSHDCESLDYSHKRNLHPNWLPWSLENHQQLLNDPWVDASPLLRSALYTPRRKPCSKWKRAWVHQHEVGADSRWKEVWDSTRTVDLPTGASRLDHQREPNRLHCDLFTGRWWPKNPSIFEGEAVHWATEEVLFYKSGHRHCWILFHFFGPFKVFLWMIWPLNAPTPFF